jgi:hypothetical protein
MGQQEMEELRRRLFLNPVGKVIVAFESSEDGSHVAVFKCETCEDVLRWQPNGCWWECPECLYELRPEESVRLASSLKLALKTLDKDARRKAGRWVWGS